MGTWLVKNRNKPSRSFCKAVKLWKLIASPATKTLVDVGRKWRAALMQLGFITPQMTRNVVSGAIDPELVGHVVNIDSLSGRAFEITPNGARLGVSETSVRSKSAFCAQLPPIKYHRLSKTDTKANHSLRFVMF